MSRANTLRLPKLWKYGESDTVTPLVVLSSSARQRKLPIKLGRIRMTNATGFYARSILISIFLLAMLLLSGVEPAQAHVDASVCASSGPASGSYTLNLCIDQPADGAVVTEVATVVVSTQVTGIDPGAWKLTAFLDGAYILTDFQAPFTFDLSTQYVTDGQHTLAVYMLMRDGFTSAPTTIQLNFQQAAPTPPPTSFTPYAPTSVPAGQSFVVAVTGDGAGGEINSTDVTNLITTWNPDSFLYLGDVYEKGKDAEFYNWYNPADRFFGRFRSITNPTIGNHEYENGSAPGYFNYWYQIPNYYSYNVAGWHFVSVNSTSQFNQRGPGSPQFEWLVQDLAANTSPCTIVYFHHPVFSIGPQGDTPSLNAMWQLFASQGVDLVLTGHDHGYQRWQPLGADGNPTPLGSTEFVVGSGGHGVMGFVRTDSRVVQGFDNPSNSYGALRLDLNPKGTAFRFVNTAGVIRDDGVIPCSGAGLDSTPPVQPSAFNAGLDTNGQVSLSWNATYDDTGVTGYTVYRDGSPLITLGSTAVGYADISAELNKTYKYTIDAVDPFGNRSTKPAEITVSTSTQASLRFNPVADTYVDANFPTSIYGTRTNLRADASPDVRSYMRFNVQGVNGHVTNAKLKIYSNNGSGTGYQLRTVDDHTWTEAGMSYANAPAVGSVVGSSGAFGTGSWIELDVTALVQHNGQLELALTTTSNTAINLGSRESITPPELVVNIDTSVPPPPVPGTFTFKPTADAYVNADLPANNYGFASSLRSDGSPNIRSYLRFNVQNIAGHVVQAKLRVYASSGSSSGYRLSETGSSWSEASIAYTSAPAVGNLIGTSGSFVTGSWTEVDVTSRVSGEGQLDFALTSTSSTGINYNSREGTNAPELVVVTSATPPPPPTAGTFTYTVAADTYVNAASPASNYGSSNVLRADASPDLHSYLRFNVQGLVGQVVQAKLRIYTNSASSVGYRVHSMTDNTWMELGTTYNNAPTFDISVAATSGAFAASTWTEVDITSLVGGDGVVNLALDTTTSTSFSLASREDAIRPPVLVIQTENTAAQ